MSNVADGLQYRHLRNTALPFITATAPTSSQPNFVDGSNIKTSYKGYLERRDGFDVGWEPFQPLLQEPSSARFAGGAGAERSSSC